MSREVRVAQLSLEILNLIRMSEHASFLAPDELKESIIRVRSMVDFLCSPLVVVAQQQATPQSEQQNEAPAQAPAEPEKKTQRAAKAKTATAVESEPETATAVDVETYDGTNREHKKILVGILKADHDFDLNEKNHAAIAGEVNGELTKAAVNVNSIQAIKETVSRLVDEAFKRRNGAPF